MANVSCTTRMLGLFLVLASAGAWAESWELRSAEPSVPGSAEIETGRIDEAISILTRQLSSATTVDIAILDNLCVAYAIKLEYDTAMRYCNQALGYAPYRAVALNNRGVLRAVTGDNRGAIQDFRRASCLRSCDHSDVCDRQSLRATVLRNLARVSEREASSVYVSVLF